MSLDCHCGQPLDELPVTCPRCGTWLIPQLPGSAERLIREIEDWV